MSQAPNQNRAASCLQVFKITIIQQNGAQSAGDFFFLFACSGQNFAGFHYSLLAIFVIPQYSKRNGFDWVLETMVHCRFDLRGPRVLQEAWLTNCGLLPLRVLVCQHDEATKLILTVVVSWMKWTWMSSFVLSFHWGHEESPGVACRAAIG